MIEILIIIVTLGGVASIVEAVADAKDRAEEREHRDLLKRLSPSNQPKKGKR